MSVAALQTEYCHACRSEVVPKDGRCPWCATELLSIELPIGRAERVSIDPFLAWAAEERVRLVAAARERGERVHNNDRGGRRLLEKIAVPSEMWLALTRSSLIAVDRVRELLARAGTSFEEVYGPDPQIIWGRGRSRRPRGPGELRVTPLPTPGVDWQPIDRPDDAYKPTRPTPRKRAYTPRDHQGAVGLTDEQVRFAAEAYLCVPKMMFAAEEIQRCYGLCGYANKMALYQGIQGHFKRMGWIRDQARVEQDLAAGRIRPAARARRLRSSRLPDLPEWLLFEAAYCYYWDQWGFQRLGRYFHPQVRTLYKGPQQLEQVIYAEFKRRGWPRRDRVEATRIASFKHGLAARDRYTKPRDQGEGQYRSWLRHQQGIVRPQCEGISKSTGERCKRAATKGSTRCPQHEPEYQEKMAAHMKRMQELSHASEVPIEPFAVWLDHKTTEFPTQLAMAAVVAADGCSTTASASSMISAVRNRRNATIRRGTIERFLIALGGNSDFEQRLQQDTADATGLAVSARVTFEDLYGSCVRGSDD